MEKYFDFKTEASRSEYWAFNLINAILTLLAGISVVILGLAIAAANENLGFAFAFPAFIAVVVFSNWVQLATAARRCNQAGISRWWMLALYIPVIGLITFIILGCLPPDPFRITTK